MNIPSISEYIDIHTHSSRDDCYYLQNIFAQDIRNGLPEGVPCSIGLHPWHIGQENTADCLAAIEEFSTQSQVLAIGETGLDRNKDVPFESQEAVFLEQIRLAEKIQKPVVIHCVKAYSDLLQIRKSKAWEMTWMFHWFNENLAIANELIDMNCYLSFGRSLLHPNGKNASVFQSIPLSRIFLETDDADVTIKNIYAKAAELKNVSLAELKENIYNNFKLVFPLPQSSHP